MEDNDDQDWLAEKDEEDYYREIEEYEYTRNKIKRLEEVSFTAQKQVWFFFSSAWLQLVSEIREIPIKNISLKNYSEWQKELPKIRNSGPYAPFCDEELLLIAESITKNHKLATRMGSLKSKVLAKPKVAFPPHHKTIKALILTWLHEMSFRINAMTPGWNFISYYYTCMGYAATIVRALDPNLGQLRGHNHIWRQYHSKVLESITMRDSLFNPFKDIMEPTLDWTKIQGPFLKIIREFQVPLCRKVFDKYSDEKSIGFFHFVHHLSEYYRYENILPVLFTRSPKYSQADVQLNGLCDYQMVWLESILISLLSADIVEFFMYNFICRNKGASTLSRRYKLYQNKGLFPEKRKAKITHGGHEILDELLSIANRGSG